MKSAKLLTLMHSDLKHALRDPALRIFLGMPLIIIPMLKWGLPALSAFFPVIEPYNPLIVAMMTTVSAFAPGFIFAFIMLDEKDQLVFDVLRVMPVSSAGFVFYRMGFMGTFGFVFGALTLKLSGVVPVSWGMALTMATLLAWIAPLICLIVVTYARNKIEGVTLFKGLNMIVMLPLIILAIDPVWEQVAGVIPFYWTFVAFEQMTFSGTFWLYVGIAMLMHLGWMALIYRQFRRKVF